MGILDKLKNKASEAGTTLKAKAIEGKEAVKKEYKEFKQTQQEEREIKRVASIKGRREGLAKRAEFEARQKVYRGGLMREAIRERGKKLEYAPRPQPRQQAQPARRTAYRSEPQPVFKQIDWGFNPQNESRRTVGRQSDVGFNFDNVNIFAQPKKKKGRKSPLEW
jgi:hypothetical protein